LTSISSTIDEVRPNSKKELRAERKAMQKASATASATATAEKSNYGNNRTKRQNAILMMRFYRPC